MLIQFSVSNFASIRDEITLSMAADADHAHEDTLIPFRKERLLPSAAIYGANAAGKTNVIRAFSAAVRTIRESNSRQVTDPLRHIVPFAFDEQSRKKPSRFEFIFTSGAVKYAYGFAADAWKVYEEYLYAYQTSKPSMIFERTNGSAYRFTAADRRKFGEYAEKNTDNKLFLATATAWNCKKTEAAYRWFAEQTDVYNRHTLEQMIRPVLADDPDGSLQKYVTNMLHAADINVTGYTVRPSGGKEGAEETYEITTEHVVRDEAGERTYSLPFRMESEGTRRIVCLSPVVKAALEQGKTVLIDEIDASLHPFLVDYILGMFSDRRQNPKGAQLIVTTQDVSLLSLDRFRRDQIYFAEKDNRTGVTDLYSLDEFAPRKNADIRRGYLQGRYGAIPVMGERGVEW